MQMLSILIWLPVIASVVVLSISSQRATTLVSSMLVSALSVVSVMLYFTAPVLTSELPGWFAGMIVAADIVLLLFFMYQGFVFDSSRVTALALLQLILFLLAEYVAPESVAMPIVVDELAKFMFLIINIVGGIIVVYAVKYMSYEAMGDFRKRLFVAYLMLFLSVMNAIVVVNSMLLFFFLFEMTTLASYLLIAFRNDAIARENALRALWMNQVGGAVILLGTLVAIMSFHTVTFSGLLESSGGWLLLVVALFSMAALVKGASIPFDSWLLGAMVAPTPVSAILHSATMVKIAPFLILKLAPALAATMLGSFIAIIGALVFTAASYLALSRSVFKEILGYSTIALLGLMVSLAAIGTEESMTLAMALILFHALSKALLFLTAGVMEKLHHVKDIEDMKGLVHRAPQSVAYVMFGFISLTLPPFGLFLGKLFAIASVASLLKERPVMLIVLLGIVIGSALLVLLYFKVASALLSHPSDVESSEAEMIDQGFAVPLMLLSILTVLAALGFISAQNSGMIGIFVLPMLFVISLPLMVRAMCRFDRVATYHCGEKEFFESALCYFGISAARKAMLYRAFGILFAAVALVGGVS